jgi:hypothetical protein
MLPAALHHLLNLPLESPAGFLPQSKLFGNSNADLLFLLDDNLYNI